MATFMNTLPFEVSIHVRRGFFAAQKLDEPGAIR
jgi:hypothetical protein